MPARLTHRGRMTRYIFQSIMMALFRIFWITKYWLTSCKGCHFQSRQGCGGLHSLLGWPADHAMNHSRTPDLSQRKTSINWEAILSFRFQASFLCTKTFQEAVLFQICILHPSLDQGLQDRATRTSFSNNTKQSKRQYRAKLDEWYYRRQKKHSNCPWCHTCEDRWLHGRVLRITPYPATEFYHNWHCTR